MKSHLTSIAAGAFLLAGIGAASADQIIVTPEQQTVIREYVHKQPPLASIDLPGVSLDIGSPLPDTVELRRVEVPDTKYEYVVINGQTYLVDSGTRQIIQVIQ